MIWMLLYGSLASATCSLPEIEQEISKRAKPESPIHSCRLDFKTALRCCTHPDQCKLPPASSPRQQAENEFDFCKKQVAAARKSCRNDRRHTDIIKEEFRRILKCADSHIAEMNGQAVKSAGDKRKSSAPPPRPTEDLDSDSGSQGVAAPPAIPSGAAPGAASSAPNAGAPPAPPSTSPTDD